MVVPLVSDTITDEQFGQLKQFISNVSLSCALGPYPNRSEVAVFDAHSQTFSPWIITKDKLVEFLDRISKVSLNQIQLSPLAPTDLVQQSLNLVNRRMNAKEGRYVLFISDQHVDFRGMYPNQKAGETGVVFKMLQLPNRQDTNSMSDSYLAKQSTLLGDSFHRYQSYGDILANVGQFTPCSQSEISNYQLPTALYDLSGDLKLSASNSTRSDEEAPITPLPKDKERVEIFGQFLSYDFKFQ